MVIVLLIIGWILILACFKKLNLHFFIFLLGSVGLFCILMYIGINTLEEYFRYSVTYSLWAVGRLTGFFSVHPAYAMITCYYRLEAISFFVDYECSGFIETLVYICLLLFYPLYSPAGKVKYLLLGTVYVLAANIIRMFTICIIVKFSGTSLFFFTHTVFARILFFIFMVILYYAVFTRPHILRQRVGNLTYGKQ